MNTYEKLAQAPLGDNILAQIASTARQVLEARDAVVAAEEALKEAQANLRALQQDILPELMSVAGQEQLVTADGLKVSVRDMIRGTPSRENEAAAFRWLRDTGGGGIIKSRVEADLGKGDPERVKSALEALGGLGIKASPRETVAWQTLGALVRERLEKGNEVPLDLLGIYMWREADVKPK